MGFISFGDQKIWPVTALSPPFNHFERQIAMGRYRQFDIHPAECSISDV